MVPRPAIPARAALIQVGACGVCGTDLHILKGHWPKPLPWPFTLGHEIGGVIVEKGADFTEDFMGKPLRIGSRVSTCCRAPRSTSFPTTCCCASAHWPSRSPPASAPCLARRFGAEATVDIEAYQGPEERIARVREIVGGFGADLVMDCSSHPSAGPEGIEFLRDGGTYVEMGQFTNAGSIETSWHRICAKDLNVLGSWAFTGNDLPLGVDMLYRGRDRYPWFDTIGVLLHG